MQWQLIPVKEFHNWSEQWQELNVRLANNLPILEPIFVSALIDCFADGNELITVGTINNEIIAMGIFCQNSLFSWQTFQPSQAPVGLWLCPADITHQALSSLIKHLPGFVLKVDILHQDPAVSPNLKTSLRNIETTDYIETSKLLIDQDFNEYFAALGKNQRQNYNKANNRLHKQNIEVKLEIETDPKMMYPSVKQYGDIESKSWKNALGTSVNINNRQGEFYQQILREFANRHNAQAWKYYYDDKLVAIDLCITNPGQLIILKTTFDSDFSRYSPAINMKLDALKPIFNDRKVQQVEFFGKTLEWHKRLNSVARTMFHFSFYRYNMLLKLKKLFIRPNK